MNKRILMLALVVFASFSFCIPSFAEEVEPTPTPDFSMEIGQDMTEAWNTYGGQLSDGLDGAKNDVSELLSPNFTSFVSELYSWIPSEILILLTLSIGCFVVTAIVRYLVA